MTNSNKNIEDSQKSEHKHQGNGSYENQVNKAKEDVTAASETEIKNTKSDSPNPSDVDDNKKSLPVEEISEEEKLKNSLKQWEDKYLRLYSEFENYKKRTFKERLDLFKTANIEVLTVLLPVLDDMERILLSAEKTKEKSVLKEGLDLVNSKFKNILKQQGLQEMEAIGKEFNTDFHEAITQIPTKNKSEIGKVIEVVGKGYFLNEKVLRYAKVVIGS